MGSEHATPDNTTLKPWSYLVTLAFIATMVMTISSCFDTIPAGITSEINGVALDAVTKKPLAGTEVAIFAACPSYDVPCYYRLESTRTNNAGEFQISFVTDGTAFRYDIRTLGDGNFAESEIKVINVGKVNTITLYGRIHGVLKLDIAIQNNSVGPIQVNTYFTQQTVFMNTRDTVLYSRVPHNNANSLTFKVYDPAISGDNKFRSISEWVSVFDEDTTFLHKEIIDPKLWPN